MQAHLNPIQDGLFQGCLQMGALFAPPLPRPSSLKSVTHILQWWNFAQLLKEDPKNV